MFCPRCRSIELKEGRLRDTGVTLDVGAKCKGVWFDQGELESLLQAAPENLKPPLGSRTTEMPCPRCGVRMRQFYFPSTFVTVDMCKRCRGLWLDGGEFKEVRAVRGYLKEMGRLRGAEPTGVKRALIQFVDRAIAQLSFW